MRDHDQSIHCSTIDISAKSSLFDPQADNGLKKQKEKECVMYR